MTEIFAPEVLYLCDGLKKCCSSPGCGITWYGGDCEHTKDPSHAKNGDVDYPQNHPERFEKFSYDEDRRVIYVEKELRLEFLEEDKQ